MPITEVLPDDAALRLARRTRLLDEMEATDVDLLIVGREGNARYVSGAPRLWTAGSRAFGPGCVLVRASGAVHLLSTWDEGIPDDIPHENLYGISFNAATFLKVLQGIEGAATARTVATDALTFSALRLLGKAFPAAQVVDGTDLLARARQVKTPEEIGAIRASVRLAESALGETVSALTPGITERQLTGVFMEAMAAEGVTTPSGQDVAWITSRDHPWRRATRDTAVAAGDLVAFEAGVLRGGYVGELGRTHAAAEDVGVHRDLLDRSEALLRALVVACQPGAPLSGLLDAYTAAGIPAPPVPVARGLGLGFDLPLVTHALPRTASARHIEVGMVFSLTAYVWDQGVGALYVQEPIAITATGPELLSTDAVHAARSH